MENVAVDSGYRTGQVLFADRTVTDNNHVIKCGGVVFHDNIDCRLTLGIDSLRLHADVADDDGLTCREVDCEISVEVGHTAIARSLFNNAGANDCFALRVFHVDLNGLCTDAAYKKQECQQERTSHTLHVN